MPVSPVQTTYKVEHVDEPMPVSPVQTTYKVEQEKQNVTAQCCFSEDVR